MKQAPEQLHLTPVYVQKGKKKQADNQLSKNKLYVTIFSRRQISLVSQQTLFTKKNIYWLFLYSHVRIAQWQISIKSQGILLYGPFFSTWFLFQSYTVQFLCCVSSHGKHVKQRGLHIFSVKFQYFFRYLSNVRNAVWILKNSLTAVSDYKKWSHI